MPEGRGNHHPKIKTIALLGNPNCGKTSVFNQLTGLHQKTGNFPGVTVEKKTGTTSTPDGRTLRLIDFPGAYSLYPTSFDERAVVQTFSNPDDENYPDAVLYIADATQLEKHLLLFSQIQSLGLPLLLGLNMSDLIQEGTIEPNLTQLGKELGVEVVLFSARTGEGMPQLRQALQRILDDRQQKHYNSVQKYRFSREEKKVATAVQTLMGSQNSYQALLAAHHHDWLPQLTTDQRNSIGQILADHQFKPLQFQVRETMQRYNDFLPAAKNGWPDPAAVRQTDRIDRWLTHPIVGPVIFFLLMLLVKLSAAAA